MLIRDQLHCQDSTDLNAFITRLNDDEGKVRANVRQYVVCEQVHERRDRMPTLVGDRLADNREVGRLIHGAFGSGKSNPMAVLGKMLEGDEAVYEIGDPGPAAAASAATRAGASRRGCSMGRATP